MAITIDGKSFNFEKSFAYQLVSADTQILCFDDVKKHFDFERLFSVVTEGMTLEKKNKDAIKIPFSRSPKVAITTNYAIKGRGNSFERRKWELEFRQFYTKDFTPLVEFGKLLFSDWSVEEWCAFDNYMIENVMFYLNNGLIKGNWKNSSIKTLGSNTSQDFIEWCDLTSSEVTNGVIRLDEKLYTNDLYNEFVQDNPDFSRTGKRTVSRTEFNKWLRYYGKYKTGNEPKTNRDMQGKWIMFITNNTVKNEEEKDGTRLPF
mgnify:FL=1